jgi:hypothetical protein
MGDKLTDGELIERLRLKRDHGPGEAARMIGCGTRAFRSSIEEARVRELTADSAIQSPQDKLKIQNAALLRDLKRVQKDADSAEAIRKEIFNLAARSPEPPAWLSGASHKVGSRGVPTMIWSDWHYGEVVRPEEVGGVNEFNTGIAEARIKRLVDTTVDLSYNHMGRAKKQYPGAVVMLGGDMMTGDIHDEITQTNDRTPQQQINGLTDALASALEKMASSFGKLYVPCVVGNHGRDSKKPRTKGRVYTSHEWVIYTNLERYFRKSKNISIHVPPESDAHFKVYNHKYLLTHGDSLGVKGGDGIIGAIGPIMRGTIKTGRSEAHIGRDFDTIVMGHWHQTLWLPGCIVNSSLKGYDEFARLVLRAPYSRPAQSLWFTHPEHGLTAKWEVFLEGQRQSQDANEWVTWQERKSA